MNPSNRPDYSTLEVDDGHLPQTAHWQGASNLPEASQGPSNLPEIPSGPEKIYTEKQLAPISPPASRTICGLRRTTFWIVIVVVMVIIIAAAVGGGVGGSEAAKSKSSATTPTSSSITTASASTASSTSAPNSSPMGILANSALASLNYTDQNNVDHVRVFYQVASKAIYQSAWNSSNKSWTVLPVTTKVAVANAQSDLPVLAQTPISANIYWHSSSQIDLHVYYLNDASALQELYIDGPGSGDGPWIESGLDSKYTVGTSGRLASYGRACAYCFDANLVFYDGTDQEVNLVQLTGNGFQQSSVGTIPTPVTGSALAAIPGAGGSENTPQMAMYINAVNLDEVYYNGSSWIWTQKFFSIPTSTNPLITAFAYDFNSTSGSNGIEVLLTNPSPSSSGLSVMSWTPTNNWQGPNSPSTFAQVTNSSGVAANLAGKVYAIVAGSGTSGSSGANDANEYSLMEWQFAGTSGNYNLVGKVTTL